MNSALRPPALSPLTAAFFALVATGCPTTKGFGQDVKSLGNNIGNQSGS